jgi:hypothetical protein
VPQSDFPKQRLSQIVPHPYLFPYHMPDGDNKAKTYHKKRILADLGVGSDGIETRGNLTLTPYIK